MKILIAGSHGTVGSALTVSLIECGYEVVRLVRHEAGPGEVHWDPDNEKIDQAALEGFDGVVHLATMPWPMRWTEKAKQKIRANRMMTNRLLAMSLAACDRKPEVLVCASGMGYYPSSGDTVLTEDSAPGSSFIATLQRDGEAVTTVAEEAGIRVIHLRIAPVLGGSALQRVGFQAGDGRQWMSWVGRDELVSIIEFAIRTPGLSGPVNAVSPNPVRNAEFAAISTRALDQKPGGVMPAFIVRLVMGEMGEEFILASRRMYPEKLLAAGYAFRFPGLDDALRHEKAVTTHDDTVQTVHA